MPWSEQRVVEEAARICVHRRHVAGVDIPMAYQIDIITLLRKMQKDLIEEAEELNSLKIDELIQKNQEIIDLLKAIDRDNRENTSKRLVDILVDDKEDRSGWTFKEGL